MIRKKLLKKLPYPVNRSFHYVYTAVPPRIRLGKTFWETYNFLKESEWWSIEKLNEYQRHQLEIILNQAYENVPYYKKILDERSLRPNDIRDFDDLMKLPFLTKSDISENIELLAAKNFPKSKLELSTTGGTTGIPLAFYQETLNNRKEWAYILNQWNRVGYKIGSKRGVLRCDIINSPKDNKYYEYNPFNNSMIFSAYHMTDMNLRRYVDKINQFKPDFLHAIPSTLTIIANFMRENKIESFASLKAVLVGGENVFPWQHKLWEEVFQRRVYTWYGHSEMAVLAGECEVSKRYHLFPQYGYTELIDQSGKRVTEDGNEGEIVATSFLNHAMPFIRYRTGDRGVYSSAACTCGRHYPMLEKVSGRIQEYIVRKDLKLISVTAALFSLHGAKMMNVKQIQLFQEEPGALIVRIEKNKSSMKEDIEKYILDAFKMRFGNSIKSKVVFVDKIEKTKRGKIKYLIQKIPIDFKTSKVSNLNYS
jgi:phenylacetate-CoA ligase